jgi:hypothetical protein
MARVPLVSGTVSATAGSPKTCRRGFSGYGGVWTLVGQRLEGNLSDTKEATVEWDLTKIRSTDSPVPCQNSELAL